MHNKYDVIHLIPLFHIRVSTQFGKSVKHLPYESGQEFQSTKLLDFYANNGMLLKQVVLTHLSKMARSMESTDIF